MVTALSMSAMPLSTRQFSNTKVLYLSRVPPGSLISIPQETIVTQSILKVLPLHLRLLQLIAPTNIQPQHTIFNSLPPSTVPNSTLNFAMAPKELNFITGNKNKLAEVQAILSETPVQLQSQNVDLVEIQGTIEEISTDKCRRAAEAVCCLAGLESLALKQGYTNELERPN